MDFVTWIVRALGSGSEYLYYRETSYHHYRKGQILNRQKSIKTQIIQNFDMIFIIYDIKLDYPQNLRFFNFTEGCQMNV